LSFAYFDHLFVTLEFSRFFSSGFSVFIYANASLRNCFSFF
jgi:hypothetical protein